MNSIFCVSQFSWLYKYKIPLGYFCLFLSRKSENESEGEGEGEASGEGEGEASGEGEGEGFYLNLFR